MTLVAGVVLCLPLALVQSPLQLLLVRVLLGLFAGGSLTLVYALANQGISAREKGAAFGVLSSVSLLGSASSPLVTGALAVVGLRAVFLLDGVLYGVALLWLAGSMRASSEQARPFREARLLRALGDLRAAALVAVRDHLHRLLRRIGDHQ